ncbi:hypothetical protein C8R44DRAFT_18644 [Mycena epipterygia]|nr:hypothetical protein C8R44DRAFT_18644 [Mycena epipterygia]
MCSGRCRRLIKCTVHHRKNTREQDCIRGSPISIEDFNDDENLAVLRRLQRRIRELEAQKEHDKGIKSPPSSLKTFQNMGRCIAKCVSTFGSIDSLVAENDRRLDLEDKRTSGDQVHDEEEEPTVEQDRAYNGFKELMRFVPALRKPLFEADAEHLAEIINALRNGARNARSDDTKNIKVAIVPWLQRLFPDMDALDSDTRDDRGMYNDDIGGILCPIEYDWQNPEIRTRIREGDPDYLVTANSWFHGLFPHQKFNPERPEEGIFMNVMLLMVWKYIFTSPISVKTTMQEETAPSTSSPRSPRGRGRPKRNARRAAPTPKRSVASIIGLTRVSGRSIAYACVQYRVALSDQHHWEEQDGSFDYIQFYNNVVDYFEFPPGPIAKKDVARLLDWWNTNVFNHPATWSLYEGATVPDSSVMRMKAARAAREVGMNL